ncbi:hypothetical protein ABZ608_41140 [Streptomyces sp. NPDC013172]
MGRVAAVRCGRPVAVAIAVAIAVAVVAVVAAIVAVTGPGTRGFCAP